MSQNSYFVPKSGCCLKKKKGLQLESISEIPIFVPNSGSSLKKKRSSIGINLRNSYFHRKIIAFSKKKRLALLVMDKTCAKLSRGPVVGPRWYKQANWWHVGWHTVTTKRQLNKNWSFCTAFKWVDGYSRKYLTACEYSIYWKQ